MVSRICPACSGIQALFCSVSRIVESRYLDGRFDVAKAVAATVAAVLRWLSVLRVSFVIVFYIRMRAFVPISTNYIYIYIYI